MAWHFYWWGHKTAIDRFRNGEDVQGWSRSQCQRFEFCSDSPYDEHDLSSLEGKYDVYSDEDTEDSNSDPLGMEPYHYEPVGLSESALTESGSDEDKDKADWRRGNTS